MGETTNLKNVLLISVFLVATTCSIAAGKTILVDCNAPGPVYDGSSWPTAFKYLQDGLSAASSGDEIQVAEGIYKPDEDSAHPSGTGDREATFQLKNVVAVKGGYAGFGEPNADARDIEVYETVLSGDLLDNDGPEFANNGENSYHVVTGSGTDATAVLDGFTITAGNAKKDYPSPHYENGGGMFNVSSSSTVTDCTFSGNYAVFGGGMFNYHNSPTVSNCTFSGNYAAYGGGMFNEERSIPILTNCMFSGNVAKHSGGYGNGGGIYNSRSDPNLVNCTFNDNLAWEGGGMSNSGSSPTVSNCTFSNNSTGWGGGGMYNNGSNPTMTNSTFSNNSAEWIGGGMYNIGSNPTMTNCTFSDNSAENGGGMCNRTYFGDISSPTLTNCTFIHNLASGFGGGMLNMESTPTVTNSTFSNNSAEWGGGMENESAGNLSLIGCTFKTNSATMGGGAIRNHTSSPTVLNCLIVGNQAQFGGAIHNENSSSNPTLINCTLSSNSATYFGGGIFSNSSSTILNNCILWANSDDSGMGVLAQIQGGLPAVNYCCIKGWTGNLGGIGNINADPCFIQPVYWDANGVWIDGDYHLHRGSPCINTGDNSAVPLSLSTDLDGNPRIVGGTVDMGVNEFWNTGILYVDRDVWGASDGSSWVNAFNDLQDALAVALPGDEIRVAQGAYSPEGPLPDIRRASNPNPDNGAKSVSITADLSWTAGSDATSHDVYFGTTSPPPFAYNQTATTFDPGTMDYSTVYYWRIDEVSEGGKTTGTVWSFRIAGAGPGSPPSLPPPPDRTATFQLKNYVVIKGGYAGFDQPDPNARDIDVYKTILSGDLAGNDVDVNDPCDLLTEPSRAENSYHVVTGSDCNESAVLDGFIITAGNANGEYYPLHQGTGGGIQIRFSTMGEEGPVLKNCTFIRNSARGGGGMNNDHSSTTLTNCTFSENFAEWGGGIGNAGYLGPKLVNCTFTANRAGLKGGAVANGDGRSTMENCTLIANHAELGGAIYNGEASATLTNCTLIGNSAERGGAVHNNDGGVRMTNCLVSENSCTEKGGVVYLGSDDGATLTNCILTANSAEKGGVLYVGDDSYAKLTNCTVTGNRATDNGGALYFDGPYDATITNCILWSNTPQEIYPDLLGSEIVITYNDVQGGWPGQGNIDADPCFVEPGYRDANGMWIDGDYHLLQTSACINAADNNSLPADTQDLDSDGNTTEPIPFDIEGNPRIVYDVVDMGPYEFYNTAPIADAGPDQIVECTCNTEEGTKVTLDGTNSSDPDRGVLTYTWTGPFVESPTHGATPTVTLESGCPGEYVITLVVNDGIDESEPNDVVITVVDTTPPDFELSVSPTMLWPPDHKMVEITPSWTVSDDCDATPDVSLVSIVVNEDDDTIGDGHTSNDIQIGADGSIYLRSERSGTSGDRVYTITYQAIDEYGNTTVRSATVSIPHDFKVLARIASRWLWAGPGRIPEDLNGDGVVNLKDIAIFANNWIQ